MRSKFMMFLLIGLSLSYSADASAQLTKPEGYARMASENKFQYANLRHSQLDGYNNLTITNNGMLGFDIELDTIQLGVGYARNNRKVFGTGQATINMETYSIYAQKNLFRNVRFGLAYYSTHVDRFTELGSINTVKVDPFIVQDIEVFVDIYHKGFYVGLSNYTSIGNNIISFQGLDYKHKNSDMRFRIGYEQRF